MNKKDNAVIESLAFMELTVSQEDVDNKLANKQMNEISEKTKKMSYSLGGSGRMQDILNKLSAIDFLRRKHLSCDLSGKKKYSRRRGEQVLGRFECNKPSLFEE